VYGDFSRVLDPRSGHYSAVLAQQGRLLLDAELNEQAAIMLDYLRRLATDLVGPFAGPAHRAGFRVELVAEGGKCRAVRLSPGHYYVYGVRCDAPAPGHAPGDDIPVGEHEAPFVVYLAVWEQSVSAIQAPDLAEPALGPSLDTTRRSQVRWRPRAARYLPGSDIDLTELDREDIVEAFEEHNAGSERRPTLGARAHLSAGAGQTPSTVPATAPYRGAENQLYRVEVHRGGDADEATFKWSRDNGSVEFGVESLTEIDGEGMRTARLSASWRDAHKGLEVGDWVELVDDHWAPFGRPAPLMQVAGVSLHKREVALHDADTERAFDPALHPLLRRWDNDDEGAAPNHGIAVSDAMGRWLGLEDGVQVQFHDPEALYQRGDFWLIPARTATGGVLWPHASDDDRAPLALPPYGPTRHLAPLALARSLSAEPHDLRTRIARHLGEYEVEHDSDEWPATDADSTAIRPVPILYRLRSTSAVAAGETFDLRPGDTTVGRVAEADIQLEHPDVSRDHAAFSTEGGRLTVRDLKSTNGTWVNDRAIAPHEPIELAPDDVVTFGTTEAMLRVESL
jgi:hypothetical protein